ncbi:MFS transporter [Sphingobium sp.]|uniref:MFS transporter n=1 Tax=Sphingobium sp. TaxID=1912891 RepID=UPI0028BE8062|nr:MFS transporter [Sphingobium sp.]
MFNAPINRWWTVVAGALGNAVGTGVVASYVLGVFVKNISHDFGWERSYATAGISCLFIVSGFGSLVLGSLMSRWSIRKITIMFVSLFSLSIMAVGMMPNSILLFCLIFSSIGFFGSAATAMPYAVAISRQFDSNRGVALALMVSGAGLGALLMPSLANWLMEHHGWRTGYFGIGLLVGIVALAGLVFCFRTPPLKDMARPDAPVFGLKEILTSKGTFWLIALSILGISIALVGLITNFVPILTDRGMSPAKAASMVGLLGAASWVSRLAVGLLLDRVHAKYVAAVIFLLAAAGIIATAVSGNSAGIYLAAIFLGLGIGAEADLITFTMSRYFPPHALSRALGAVWIFWAWGNGLGVFMASLSYDLTGSYNLAFLIFTTLAVSSCAVILRLGAYEFPAHANPIAAAGNKKTEITA